MEKTVQVKNELGMHARPAGFIAKLADKAVSEVKLHHGKAQADACSVIDILTLGAVKGSEIVIEIADDEDAEILYEICDFFESGFGEI